MASALTAAAPSPAPLTGVWSGDRVTLVLTPTGGELVEDCATSTIDSPVIRARGNRFVAKGRHEQASGGPQRADEGPPATPNVRYAGTFKGKALALKVSVAGAPAATYNLLPGRNFKPVRCL